MEKSKDTIGTILISTLLILLGVMGFIYYKSIDWNVLQRLEQTPLALPTPNSSSTATQSATLPPSVNATEQ